MRHLIAAAAVALLTACGPPPSPPNAKALADLIAAYFCLAGVDCHRATQE